MTTKKDASKTPATIWIDHEQAIITTNDADGDLTVEHLGRGSGEPEVAFDARAVDQVLGHDPVNVSGPAYARTSFERVYSSMTQHPDRLVDVEPDLDADDADDRSAARP